MDCSRTMLNQTNQINMNILAVDPSVNNVGLAYYKTAGLMEATLETALFHPEKGAILQKKGNQLIRFLHLKGWKPDKLIIEYPQWEGSQRGAIAAQQGYTLDLAYLCGMLVGWSGLGSKDIFLPTPRNWKGNLPKKATEHRVKEKFGFVTSQISEHEFDSVGLLMWWQDTQGNSIK